MDLEINQFGNLSQPSLCESGNESEDDIDDDEWYKREELDCDDKEIIDNGSEKAFGFETDHAALKGNSDYHCLIKALTILQGQRIKIVEDIDRLEKLQIKVKANPREFLEKLVNGDTSDIPSHIEVQKVPTIDWTKYNKKNKLVFDEATNEKTNYKKKAISLSKEIETNTAIGETSSMDITVRGRVFDQSKPQTFNQLWTAEEQLRLEELLVEYPPERNENNRWRKIAQALGNRTTKQVCSRVQKYFKKLNQAGLPIPGHQLKTNNMTSLKKKPRRLKKDYTRDSTFFPTQHLGAPQHLDSCEDDENKTKIPSLTSELKTDIVKKVIEFKKKDAGLPPFSHSGIMCAVCGEIPLQGTRWTCLVCQNVNLCSDCVVDQLRTDQVLHPLSHPLEPLSNPSVAHWDPDYTPDSFKSNNYLDPNFVTPNVL